MIYILGCERDKREDNIGLIGLNLSNQIVATPHDYYHDQLSTPRVRQFSHTEWKHLKCY